MPRSRIIGSGLRFGGGFGGTGITYLLRDTFTTTAAAPLTSPRTCEPTGTLTLTQTDGEFSISSGKLNFVAQATPVWGDQGFAGSPVGGGAFSRVAGKAWRALFNVASIVSNPRVSFMWNKTTAPTFAQISGASLTFRDSLTIIVFNSSGQFWDVGAYLLNTDFRVGIIQATLGNIALIKGGAYTDATLLYVDALGSDASVYPTFANMDGAGTIDYVDVTDLPGVLAGTVYSYATFTDTTLTTGDTFTGTADGFHKFDFAQNGSPSAGDEIVMEYRRQDASNKWEAVVKRNAGNTNWDIFLYKTVAGSRTQMTTAANIGTVTTAQIQVIGNVHRMSTLNVAALTQRGAAVTDAAFNTQTGMGIVAAAGTTLTRLSSWSSTLAAYTAALNFP